jgi:tripartite-type tricarboxylate transporter receptor subunit TctC
MRDRRRALRLALAAMAVPFAVPFLGGALHAQSAERPIHIVFPFAAGGSGDVLARMIAGKMQDSLDRQVVVDDRPGSAGRAGVAAVKAAAPDGNTLLLSPIAPMAVFPFVYTKLDYDPIRDFVPISQLAIFDFGIAVGPQVDAKTLPDLVAWAKANPAQAKYAVPGAGTLPHLLGVLFGSAANVDLQEVGYRGSAEALADVVSGHVPIIITTTGDLITTVKTGRIRVLATSSSGHSPFLPSVPTLREAGYKLAATGWYGLFAPANTPPEIIARYNKAVVEAVRSPDVESRLLALGLQPTGSSANSFAKIVRDSSELWGPAVNASGLSQQD